MINIGILTDPMDEIVHDVDYTKLKDLMIKKLLPTIRSLTEKNKFEFIMGGTQGVDLLLNYLEPDMKYKLALPYGNQDENYTETEKQMYKRLKECANETVFVDTIKEYDLTIQPNGLHDRNKLTLCDYFIIDKSDYLIYISGSEEFSSVKTWHYGTKLLGDKSCMLINLNE